MFNPSSHLLPSLNPVTVIISDCYETMRLFCYPFWKICCLYYLQLRTLLESFPVLKLFHLPLAWPCLKLFPSSWCISHQQLFFCSFGDFGVKEEKKAQERNPESPCSQPVDKLALCPWTLNFPALYCLSLKQRGCSLIAKIPFKSETSWPLTVVKARMTVSGQSYNLFLFLKCGSQGES